MKKQPPDVEWMVAENDADWERLAAQSLPDKTQVTKPRLQRTWPLWITIALLLVAVVSSGEWWWRSTQTQTQQRATPALALDPLPLDPATIVTNGLGNPDGLIALYQQTRKVNGLRAAIQHGAPAAHLDIPLQAIKVQGEQAVAQVVIYNEHGAPAYRQTRFYQSTANGWLRTAPDAELWGAKRSLETPYFVYHFRQHDAAVVTAVAPQIDALYATLRRNFALPMPTDGKKLVLDVNLTQTPGLALTQPNTDEPMRIASPALYLAPIELTDEQLLAQAIALPLLNELLVQATVTYGLKPAWRPMRKGLFLWQLWNLDLPLAVWREEVVKWLYQDAPTTSPTQLVRLPTRYAALCTAHTLWMAHPVQIGIPFGCNELEQQASSIWWQFVPPTHLAQLAVPVLPNAYGEPVRATDLVTYPGQTVVLATLIDYAVATYGRERLPALVAGLGQYDCWETLLPAVYGVSPGEFEAGWQAYLVTHYGVNLATVRQ